VRPLGDAAGNVYQFESSGVLNQNQFIVFANTRLNPRFTFGVNYALNKANSDTDGVFTFPADNYDLTGEYGRAAHDIRHRFNLFGNFESPIWGLRFNPFVSAFSGRPFNITTGLDNNGDTTFNDRPSLVSANTCAVRTPAGENIYCTPYGTFNVRPAPGDEIIPRNFGQAPAFFSVNMRVSKTIGIGTRGGNRAAANTQAGAGAGQQSAGGGGRRGGGGRQGGGGRGGFGPGGMFGGPGGASDSRYQLTFGANFTNIFNRVNLAAPIGNLSSTLFGQPRSIIGGFGGFGPGGGGPGGAFGGAAGNRRVELQVRFNF